MVTISPWKILINNQKNYQCLQDQTHQQKIGCFCNTKHRLIAIEPIPEREFYVLLIQDVHFFTLRSIGRMTTYYFFIIEKLIEYIFKDHMWLVARRHFYSCLAYLQHPVEGQIPLVITVSLPFRSNLLYKLLICSRRK